jgi:Cof subfamily protein (haloacid dehalogenase superfamily)
MDSCRLICSDIDGTLLNKDRQLSAATVTAVKALPADIPFILISSRMPASLRQLQQQLGIMHHPLIAYNGSLIVDGDAVLYSKEIPTSILQHIAAMSSAVKVHMSLYRHDTWMVPAMDYWAQREANNTGIQPRVMDPGSAIEAWAKEEKGGHKVMLMGHEQSIQALEEELQQRFAQQLHLYRSKPTYLEISDKQQDKAMAMQTLLNRKYVGMTMSDVLAFGDNHNDTTLLAAAGCGVAVANAAPTVQAAANTVTASNIKDGVAVFLNEQFSLL